VARIEVNPAGVRKTNVKVDGFVERIYVDFVGQAVRKGQPLFTLYSPSLLSAQNEYLLALQTREAWPRARLVGERRDAGGVGSPPPGAVGCAGSEMSALRARGSPPRPDHGVAYCRRGHSEERGAGGTGESGEAPYEITDLNEVWVMADAYETDLARIRVGMKAT